MIARRTLIAESKKEKGHNFLKDRLSGEKKYEDVLESAPATSTLAPPVENVGGRTRSPSMDQFDFKSLEMFADDGSILNVGSIDFSLTPGTMLSIPSEEAEDGQSMNPTMTKISQELQQILDQYSDDTLIQAISLLSPNDLERLVSLINKQKLGSRSPTSSSTRKGSSGGGGGGSGGGGHGGGHGSSSCKGGTLSRKRQAQMKVGNFGEPTSYSTPSLFTTTSSSALSNSSNDNNSNATTNDVGLSLSFLNITKKKDTLTWMETMAWDAKNANIFSERNDNDDISWEPHVTEDETAWRLSGATFTALLDFITNNLSSKALVNTILVTHEHFTTPDELMRQFVVNFNKATADGNKDKQTSIVYALKQWWKHNLEVFQEGSKVVEELQTFFDFLSQDPEKNDFCSWHRMLVGWWKGALEEAEDDFNSKQMHRILKQSIVCIRNKQSLLEFLPEDVAQQLTLRDHYYFRICKS
eukprot:TRINITY_DN6508_c0_g1_i17.p1 TRINITY_DN6508_c0_g1~~TRINITY_DN6508_c0_g1_i17.p1  ORF type:complete len:470 (+),score=121.63 TRINITY_DN6508_c0_g1_i17:167-1576(+)